MRSLKRIDIFTDELNQLWKEKAGDWRFGQLMLNFLGWIYSEKGRDPFFVEEEQMLEYLKEFLKGDEDDES